jgi:hypothetical protein
MTICAAAREISAHTDPALRRALRTCFADGLAALQSLSLQGQHMASSPKISLTTNLPHLHRLRQTTRFAAYDLAWFGQQTQISEQPVIAKHQSLLKD